MSLGLSHIGATPARTASAVAEEARANWLKVQAMAAADRMNAQDERAVQPTPRLVQTPAQVRDQVMAERGMDRRALMRLPAQARLEAEVSIDAETANRSRQAQGRSAGGLLDIRV